MVLTAPGPFELDARQAKVFEALLERHADLAGMYRMALWMLSSTCAESDRRIRVAHVCHSMREIVDRFADVMGARKNRIEPPAYEQAQALPALLRTYEGFTLSQDLARVPVPKEIAEAFDKLARTAEQEAVTHREFAASLFTDDGDDQHPAVKEWMAARKFFVTWGHIHKVATDPSKLPSDDVILTHIRVVEDLVGGAMTMYFDRQHTIHDLVAGINKKVEASDQ